MDKVIIIGGKGGAVVIAEQIYDHQIKTKEVEFLGFAFDDESLGQEINGFPILCKTYDAYDKYKDDKEVKFIYQLYRPDLMKERIELFKSFGIPRDRMYTFVHHSATVCASAKLGEGTVVLANSVINSNAVVGCNCTIHSNVLIGHDTWIGNHNFIAGHTAVGSSSRIGDGNFTGLNCTINNYIKIGSYNFVGMGSNVIKGMSDGKKVYGNPAKEFESEIKPL